MSPTANPWQNQPRSETHVPIAMRFTSSIASPMASAEAPPTTAAAAPPTTPLNAPGGTRPATAVFGWIVFLALLGGPTGDALAHPNRGHMPRGISARTMSLADGVALHVYEVDLRRYRVALSSYVRSTARKPLPTARQMGQRAGALLAVNGGFFDRRWRPMGWRVSAGHQLQRPLKRQWGVLWLAGQRAGVAGPKGVAKLQRRTAKLDVALQVGPRLVDHGRPVSLLVQHARRAAVGVRSRGRRLVFAISEGGSVESNLLARIFATPRAKGGLGCDAALMLDGGPSAQLWTAPTAGGLHVPGMYGVPDGLVVLPRR